MQMPHVKVEFMLELTRQHWQRGALSMRSLVDAEPSRCGALRLHRGLMQ